MALANAEIALVLKLVADQFNSELKKSGLGVDGFLGKFNGWKTGLAAAGGALFAIAKATANAGDAALDNSQKVQLSVESYQKLDHAAKLSGSSIEQLSGGLRFLNKNLEDAASNAKSDAAQSFKAMGIEIRGANGEIKGTEQLLLETADVFASYADGPTKGALAMKVFGKAGTELLPFLNEGRSKIEALMAEAERLGVVMSEKDARAASDFNDSLDRLSARMAGVRNAIGVELIPVLTEFATILLDLSQGGTGKFFSDWLKSLIFMFVNLGAQAAASGQQIALAFSNPIKYLKGELKGEMAAIQAELDGYLAQKAGALSGDMAGTGTKKGPDTRGKAPVVIDASVAKKEADELLKYQKEQYQLYITGLTAMGEEKLRKDKEGFELWMQGLLLQAAEQKKKREDDLRGHRELSDAKVAMAEAEGKSVQEISKLKVKAIQAALKQELDDVTKNEDQKEAIRLRATAAIITEEKKASGGFFDGYADAMKRYAEDTSMLGLGVDMARKTADGMSNAFQQGFFDVFSGKMLSAQSALEGFGNFVNQLSSQILSQMLTKQILMGAAGAGGGGGFAGFFEMFKGAGFGAAANGGIFGGRRFASGGTLNQPEMVLAGEAGPEAFVPLPDGKRIPVSMGGGKEQVIEVTIMNEVRLPNQSGGGLREADVINIIDANMKNGGVIHKTVRRGGR